MGMPRNAMLCTVAVAAAMLSASAEQKTVPAGTTTTIAAADVASWASADIDISRRLAPKRRVESLRIACFILRSASSYAKATEDKAEQCFIPLRPMGYGGTSLSRRSGFL